MRSWAPNNHMVYLPWVMYIDTGKYIKYIKLSRHSTSLLAIRMFLAGSTPCIISQTVRISMSMCVCMLVWYGMAWYGMMWYGMQINAAYTRTPSQRRNASCPGIRVFRTVQPKNRPSDVWRPEDRSVGNGPTLTANRPTVCWSCNPIYSSSED